MTRAGRWGGFVLLSSVIVGAPAEAQHSQPDQRALCTSYQSQVDSLSKQLPQAPLWDDATIARARSSLSSLEASRRTLVTLMHRLNGADQFASNAEAFDKSGEQNYWRRDAREIRAQIDNEKEKAKAWGSAAGVSCSGCTYSVLVEKVRAAIDAAVAARTQAYQVHQQIISYKSALASAGC